MAVFAKGVGATGGVESGNAVIGVDGIVAEVAVGGCVKVFIDTAVAVVGIIDGKGVVGNGEISVLSFDARFDAAEKVVGAASGIDDGLDFGEVNAFTFFGIINTTIAILTVFELNAYLGIGGAVGEIQDKKHGVSVTSSGGGGRDRVRNNEIGDTGVAVTPAIVSVAIDVNRGIKGFIGGLGKIGDAGGIRVGGNAVMVAGGTKGDGGAIAVVAVISIELREAEFFGGLDESSLDGRRYG